MTFMWIDSFNYSEADHLHPGFVSGYGFRATGQQRSDLGPYWRTVSSVDRVFDGMLDLTEVWIEELIEIFENALDRKS